MYIEFVVCVCYGDNAASLLVTRSDFIPEFVHDNCNGTCVPIVLFYLALK